MKIIKVQNQKRFEFGALNLFRILNFGFRV